MAEMTPWVHQYTLRELIDDTFDLFRERASTLLLAGVLPFLLLVVYVVLMRVYVIPGNLLEEMLSNDAWEDLLFSKEILLFSFGFILLSGLAVSCTYIAQCRIAAWHALGLPVSLPRAFRYLAKPLLGMVVVGMLYGVLAFVALIVAAFVGGILVFLLGLLTGGIAGSPAAAAVAIISGLLVWLLAFDSTIFTGVYFLVAPVVLAFEHAWPGTAIGKSFQAGQAQTKSYFWALYVITRLPVLIMLAGTALSYLLQGPMAYIAPTAGGMIISLLISALSNIFFAALLACLQTLAYVDYRCRRDALDLQLLAREIGLDSELEAALAATPVTTAPQYPDYAAAPAMAGAPAAAVPGLTAPSAHAAFPDYSKPPVASAASPAIASSTPAVTADDSAAPPVVTFSAQVAYPDYSAPPSVIAPAPSTPAEGSDAE